jgi:hypothetical protein
MAEQLLTFYRFVDCRNVIVVKWRSDDPAFVKKDVSILSAIRGLGRKFEPTLQLVGTKNH